jgi:outer membrane lipoprotein-sorting protein
MMRWFLTVAVLALAAPASAQDAEAEKLFRQVEKKLAAAKTIKVAFDGDLTWSGKVVISFTGKLAVGDGDKFFVETTRSGLGNKEHTVLVSDGEKVVEKDLVHMKLTTRDRPRNLGAYLRGAMVRAGLVMSMDMDAPAPRPKAEEYWKTTNFKLADKEIIDKIPTQAIDFPVAWDKTKTAKVRLWIDPKNSLPVRLRLTREQDGASLQLTENYREFLVDGKLEDNQFELPK